MEYLLYEAERDEGGEFYIRIDSSRPCDGGRFESDAAALAATAVDAEGVPRFTNEELDSMMREADERWPSEEDILADWQNGSPAVGDACWLFTRYRFVGMRHGVLVFAHH
jgi:hypothetical protein